MRLTRRELLRSAFIAGGTLLVGGWRINPSLAQIAGGKMLGTLRFFNEGGEQMEKPLWSGLDGRLYTRLSTLDESSLITPTDKFYVRTRCPDQIDLKTPWTIKVNGLVHDNRALKTEDLLERQKDMGVHLMECSGNPRQAHFGMLSACQWSGVPMCEILDETKIQPEATQILVSGFDGHSQPSMRSQAGASWIFPLEQFRSTQSFLATQMNGAALTADHGYPVRLVVPGWYGCTCIKWVNEIRFLDDRAESTSQMREFASRTHQIGVPELARQFRPAIIDQAAMPIRVEKWLVGDGICYRVVGIMWGGSRRINGLAIRFRPDQDYTAVDHFDQQSNQTWSLWSYVWKPKVKGRYAIQLKVKDADVPTKRLDLGYYDRWVDIQEI